MNRLLNLEPIVGNKRTLLITCTDVNLIYFRAFKTKVFTFPISESQLVRYNPHQQELLQHYIERESCAQVIFIGLMDENAIDRISKDNSFASPMAALKFNLSALLKDQHEPIVSQNILNQLCIELNVINQCKLLMDYYFIQQRVEKRELHLKGVATEGYTGLLKSIFYNGIVYNDIISMN